MVGEGLTVEDSGEEEEGVLEDVEGIEEGEVEIEEGIEEAGEGLVEDKLWYGREHSYCICFKKILMLVNVFLV